MPILFSEIASDTAKVKMIYKGQTLNIEYYPSKITDRVLEAATVLIQGGTDLIASLHAVNQILLELLKSWDLFTDAANTVMYPIDEEHIKALPYVFKVDTANAIVGDMRPNAERGQIVDGSIQN